MSIAEGVYLGVIAVAIIGFVINEIRIERKFKYDHRPPNER